MKKKNAPQFASVRLVIMSPDPQAPVDHFTMALTPSFTYAKAVALWQFHAESNCESTTTLFAYTHDGDAYIVRSTASPI